MATDFTNKYMQVFQTYDEFGEHSADYVKGEDHLAYLIQENEVIYWLYLEQVWRPLNVRTTTTGELEDGRTKVAVRLEYIEGSQKYTSVPNIPDPERITSMSRFLEDYPDIEEVNVSGTVNLTDLSYAFANSKIKDFSMLDTSNVTNIEGIIDNVNNKDLDITIKYKTNYNEEQDIAFNNIILNKLELIQLLVFDYYIEIHDSNINKLILNNQRIVLYGTNGSSIINEIESDNYVSVSSADGNSKGNKISNIVANEININPSGLVDDNILNIKFNKLIIKDSNFNSYNWKNKIVCLSNDNVCNIVFAFDYTRIYNFSFGYGIDYSLLPNANLAVRDDCIIGNFIFTVPIVNDDFYNKYSNANKISIFQYKTAFEEIADVKISKDVDSNLIYYDTLFPDFDCNNLSVEIHNNVDIKGTTYRNSKNYKKLIIDNSATFDGNNYNTLSGQISYVVGGNIIDWITAEEGYLSGYYKNSSNYIQYNSLFKNITFSNINLFYVNGDYIDSRNIKFVNSDNLYIALVNGNGYDINYKNLLDENNNLNATFYLSYNLEDAANICQLVYYEDIEVNVYINNTAHLIIYNRLANIENHPLNVNAELIVNTSVKSTDSDINIQVGNLYVNCSDNGFLSYLYVYGEDSRWKQLLIIDNIYGVANIKLPLYNSQNYFEPNENTYKHIDINKVICDNLESTIIPFENLDDESTINLITKLIDNASYSSKIIYMYRTQANIIGEENIAAAVAKNYEFAIIEN